MGPDIGMTYPRSSYHFSHPETHQTANDTCNNCSNFQDCSKTACGSSSDFAKCVCDNQLSIINCCKQWCINTFPNFQSDPYQAQAYSSCVGLCTPAKSPCSTSVSQPSGGGADSSSGAKVWTPQVIASIVVALLIVIGLIYVFIKK